MNKVIKYSVAALVAGLFITSIGNTGGAPVLAASNTKSTVQQPSVVLKWKGTTLSQKGLLINGNTMIPLSLLRDQLGLPLSYNPGTRTYSLGKGYRQLNMDVNEYWVNTNINNYYVDDYVVKNIGGKLYVPFKLMSDYLGYQGVWNSASKSLSMKPRVENAIGIRTESSETNTKDAVFLLRYPKISGLGNAEAENNINVTLEKLTNKFFEESKLRAAERESAFEYTYQFLQSYMVTYNENGMLSIVVDQYSFTGGAHGGTIRTGLTFSLKDGKILSLDDLLKEKSPQYKAILDKIALEGLQKDDGYFDGEGAFKGLKEDPNYYLKPDGLALFFQQYEHTAYSSGLPTIVISYSQFSPKGINLFK